MDDLAVIFKALSDPNRQKVMCALEEGRLCACQVIELLDLAPSTVSRHMEVLEHAGLVRSTKHQRWVYYEPAGNKAAEPVKKVLKLLSEMYPNLDGAQEVKKQIEKIKSISPEELCRKKREI